MGRLFLPFVPLPAWLSGVGGVSPGFDPRAEQSRLAEVVVRVAAAMVAADDDPQALVERKCRLLTTMAPHLVLAWTWFGPPQADTLRPQVVAGAASAYARALVIRRTPLTGIGPAFRTLAGKRLEPFNVSTMSLYGPWRLAAREHGVKSVLALPLASTRDDQRGLFVLYADVEDYFDRVGIGLFEALAQLFSAVLSRMADHARLAHAAHHDSLTGLHNRQALSVLLPPVLRHVEADPPVAVLLIDLDHFKRINDTHGHDAGDAALRHAAQVLRDALRGGDVLLRWGGEEFVAVLRGTGPQDAERLADGLRGALRREPAPVAADRHETLTASVGVAPVAVGEALTGALLRADAALLQAKALGRDRTVMADGG